MYDNPLCTIFLKLPVLYKKLINFLLIYNIFVKMFIVNYANPVIDPWKRFSKLETETEINPMNSDL